MFAWSSISKIGDCVGAQNILLGESFGESCGSPPHLKLRRIVLQLFDLLSYFIVAFLSSCITHGIKPHMSAMGASIIAALVLSTLLVMFEAA